VWTDFGGFCERRSAARSAFFRRYYGSSGDTWAVLDRLTADAPAVVAYAGTAVVYPLFGPRLQNTVVYVPLAADEVNRPVTLGPGSGESVYRAVSAARRARVDPDYWLSQLRARQVRYLYLGVAAAEGTAHEELRIVTAHPEVFTPVFAAGVTSLWRVSAPSDHGAAASR
jgi:hypothetical protein